MNINSPLRSPLGNCWNLKGAYSHYTGSYFLNRFFNVWKRKIWKEWVKIGKTGQMLEQFFINLNRFNLSWIADHELLSIKHISFPLLHLLEHSFSLTRVLLTDNVTFRSVDHMISVVCWSIWTFSTVLLPKI